MVVPTKTARATNVARTQIGYVPLQLRAKIFHTVEIQGDTTQEKKNNYFNLMRGNTLRERATLDLLYTHPDWLVQWNQGNAALALEI